MPLVTQQNIPEIIKPDNNPTPGNSNIQNGGLGIPGVSDTYANPTQDNSNNRINGLGIPDIAFSWTPTNLPHSPINIGKPAGKRSVINNDVIDTFVNIEPGTSWNQTAHTHNIQVGNTTQTLTWGQGIPEKGSTVAWTVANSTEQITMNYPEQSISSLPKAVTIRDNFSDDVYKIFSDEDIRNLSGPRTAAWHSEPHIIYRPYEFSGHKAHERIDILGLGSSMLIDMKRQARAITSPKGLIRELKQTALQLMSPRPETMFYNPLSYITARTVPIINIERHLGLSWNGALHPPVYHHAGGWQTDGSADETLDEPKNLSWGAGGELQQKVSGMMQQKHGTALERLTGHTFEGVGEPQTTFWKPGFFGLSGTTPEGWKDISENKGKGGQPNAAKYKALAYGEIRDVRDSYNGSAWYSKNLETPAGRTSKHPDYNSTTKPNLVTTYGYAEAIDDTMDTRDWTGDTINQTDILEGTEEYPDNLKDMIKFKIYIKNTDELILFRATITDLSEDITPNWETINYIGRPDPVYLYKDTERKVSFKFTVAPTSKKEMAIAWKKLNKVCSLNYPSYADVSGGGKRMVPPFVNLTIGDYIKDMPGYFEQLQLTPHDETYWELTNGMQLPRYVEIDCSYVIVGKSLPDLTEPSYFDFDTSLAGGDFDV